MRKSRQKEHHHCESPQPATARSAGVDSGTAGAIESASTLVGRARHLVRAPAVHASAAHAGSRSSAARRGQRPVRRAPSCSERGPKKNTPRRCPPAAAPLKLCAGQSCEQTVRAEVRPCPALGQPCSGGRRHPCLRRRYRRIQPLPTPSRSARRTAYARSLGPAQGGADTREPVAPGAGAGAGAGASGAAGPARGPGGGRRAWAWTGGAASRGPRP